MKRLIFIITVLSFSFINAFSLKDKITNGNPGDYVVTEQGGTSSVLLIRSLTSTHLIIEEIDVPSLMRKSYDGNWKEWIAQDAPGHTAWITYVIDIKNNQLQECYSHSQGVWLSTQDNQHFLPRLLTLSLQKTPQEGRKRIGPPPNAGEEDRRSIWNPSVIVEGKKLDKAAITAWVAKWPNDGSLISNCEIEVYFSSLAFPVWIEVRSPHYKASLRAIDSGHAMSSPRPIVFQQSPLILGSSGLKKDHFELHLQCPTYYNALKIFAVDLTDPSHPLVELTQTAPLEESQMMLKVPEKTLAHKLIKGHQYRWVLIPVAYPSMVIYSDQIFQW
jgi:hypothetical protein